MKVISSNVKFPNLEEEILDSWNQNKTFQRSNEIRHSGKQFSFYDGPPFANGLPHYGHLLANTIKDTVPRYWNMRGYQVERRFGWDCHGLPVEFEIEKREELKGRDDILKLGVHKFNEFCRESVLHYAAEWQTVINRLGRWVDWDHQYRTMDLDFMESVWWVFKKLDDMGLVYQSHKVVSYSPRITAVLSNFEANQNYKDIQDPAITVKFRLKDDEAFVLAWTTTPWTLISNLALAVGPDIDYVRIRDKESGEVFVLAQERVASLYKKKPEEQYDLLEAFKGSALLGKSYEPLFPYFSSNPESFKILEGDFVTTDSGTGIVHCAPAFGEDDHRICAAAKIPLVDPLDEQARFLAPVEEYKGQYIKDADKEIIRDLKGQGKILRHETIVHSYPFCERTDHPLIYRAIPAWFVRVEEIKSRLVENNQKINWVPGHLKNGRMGKWLDNARDWAISRNRFWGTPIPIWICDQDKDHKVCLGSRKDLEDRIGFSVDDIHKHFVDDYTFQCPHCSGTMRRIPEVFDCWFESGSMPYAQLHYPFENSDKFNERFPADFIAEGLDQTRGWFYTLSILSGALFKSPAFKNVVVNGMVLAEDGKKMSKRWKNYTPPTELIDTYGADSVRLYMLNSSILRGEDLKFANQGVKDTTRAVLLPLWNSYSFLSTYAKADGWTPTSGLLNGDIPEVEGLLDRWIISRFQTLVTGVHEQMEAYKLYNVVPRVLEFIEDLTNWYIRLSRRRFWAGAESMSQDTQDAYNTLFYVLFGFSKVFAPFAPFTADAIYRCMVDGEEGIHDSVHLHEIPLANKDVQDSSMEKDMSLVRRVVELGRSLRAQHQIKTRQVLPSMLIISRNNEDAKFIAETEGLIRSELNLKKVEFSIDELQYVTLSLKPNLRTLGRRLGKKLNEFKKFLTAQSQDQAKIASMLDQIEGEGFSWEGESFGPSDFLIERGPKDQRLVASDQGITVLLDTTLTEELLAEGLAREVINRIQNLRRDTGLKVTDRIVVKMSGSAAILEAVDQNRPYVAEELLAKDLLFSEDSPKGTGEGRFDIDGDELVVAIDPVS